MIYFCPTPIGNLGDITLRTLEVLRSVDIIYAEDTRVTIKLLNHYDINKKLKTYHKFNEAKASLEIIESLENGLDIGLVTDAGMPGISDPGHVLIKKLIEKRNLKTLIEVDGGIKLDNAKDVLDAGADILVSGSGIFEKGRTRENIKAFKELLWKRHF